MKEALAILALMLCTAFVSAQSPSEQEITTEIQQTLAIVKPEAVAANHLGDIITRIEAVGLRIVGAKMTHLSEQQAQEFYSEHREKPFFDDLVQYMTSGPVVAMTLEGPDAIIKYRGLMGATNPAEAAPNTLRATYGTSLSENAVHGSDSVSSARREVAFFFGPTDLCPRTR